MVQPDSRVEESKNISSINQDESNERSVHLNEEEKQAFPLDTSEIDNSSR